MNGADSNLNILLKMGKADRERYIKFAKKLAAFTHVTVEEALEHLLDQRYGGR